jgi:hypothetical protein
VMGWYMVASTMNNQHRGAAKDALPASGDDVSGGLEGFNGFGGITFCRKTRWSRRSWRIFFPEVRGENSGSRWPWGR